MLQRVRQLIPVLLLLLSACATESIPEGPPPGWEGDATRWWIQGQDTTGYFRDLETLESMGAKDSDVVYVSEVFGGDDEVVRQQFKKAVKRSLIRMYRNEPEIVDSLFEELQAPKIDDVVFTSDPAGDVDKFKKKSYKALSRHFREPRTRLQLGTDVPVVYPDSIRNKEISGSVKLQVYLNAEGEPQSVELLEGIYPVLDLSAMDATTRMRWLPAYILKGKNWQAIPAWARFRITFSTKQAGAGG